MVPRLLNEEQKEQRVQVCRDILEQLETEPNLLKRAVTGDSHGSLSTIHSPNGRALNGRAHCHQDQKGEDVQVQNQGDADHFFDVHGIVHAEFLHKAKLLISTSTKQLATSDALSEGE